MNREIRRHPTHPFLPVLQVSKTRVLNDLRQKFYLPKKSHVASKKVHRRKTLQTFKKDPL